MDPKTNQILKNPFLAPKWRKWQEMDNSSEKQSATSAGVTILTLLLNTFLDNFHFEYPPDQN